MNATGFAADIIGRTFDRTAGFGSERNDRRRRRLLRGGRDHGHEGGEDKNGEGLHVGLSRLGWKDVLVGRLVPEDERLKSY